MECPVLPTGSAWRLSHKLTVPKGVPVQEPHHDRLEDVRVVTVVEPEFDLGQVGIQVLRADLMPCADDRALQEAPDALYGVRVDLAYHPLLFGVLDRRMARVRVRDTEVGFQFIRVDGFGIGPGVPGDKRVKRGPLDVWDSLDTDLSTALDGSGDPRLAGPDAALLTADKGFVHFDDTEESGAASDGALHGRPDPVAQVPRRLVGDANRSLDLVRADALLRLTNQVDGDEPLPERKVRVIEDGSRGNAESVAAPVTVELVPSLDLGDGQVPAPGATNFVGPAQLFEVLPAGIFVAEPLDKRDQIDIGGVDHDSNPA